jgi:23S rRNA (uracil1939-C5)-methyltransferase
MIPAASEWQYRNHAQFALNAEGKLCYRGYGSRDLVPIRECHIIAPPLVEMFNTLELEGAEFDAVNLRAGINTSDRMIVFESSDPTPPAIEIDEPVSIAFQVGDVVVPLVGNDKLHETLLGRAFAYSPNAFFQVNTPMAEKLIQLVREFLEPRGNETLLDAYSGVGIFGLSLAHKVARVVMIEENPNALEDARANAGELTNVEFHLGRVEEVLPKLDRQYELAVLDPPREGCDKLVVEACINASPRTVVYVSCDPTTLARDAARLVAGGYHLETVQPVDMFPQTYHIECVAKFTRHADA